MCVSLFPVTCLAVIQLKTLHLSHSLALSHWFLSLSLYENNLLDTAIMFIIVIVLLFSPLIAAAAHGQSLFVSNLLSQDVMRALYPQIPLAEEEIHIYKADINITNLVGQTALIYAGADD